MEIPRGEIIGKYTRSVSQLKGVTRCGEAFRLERLAKPRPPRRPAAWTILGTAIHSTFQDWEVSERQLDTLELFESHFDRLIEEERGLQPDLRYWQRAPNAKTVESDIANYRKRGLTKDVPQYTQRCLEAEWEILRLPDGELALELEYELEFPGDELFSEPVVVKGSIDRLQWWPKLKKVTVEDTKSGSPDDECDTRQLGTYAVAAGEIYGIDLTQGRYWFTKLDRPGEWVDLRRWTADYAANQYRIADRMISEGLLLPKPGKQCGLCGVKPWCRELGWLQPGEELFESEE